MARHSENHHAGTPAQDLTARLTAGSPPCTTLTRSVSIPSKIPLKMPRANDFPPLLTPTVTLLPSFAFAIPRKRVPDPLNGVRRGIASGLFIGTSRHIYEQSQFASRRRAMFAAAKPWGSARRCYIGNSPHAN